LLFLPIILWLFGQLGAQQAPGVRWGGWRGLNRLRAGKCGCGGAGCVAR